MALTKEKRDSLPDSDFAVPETRDLPIYDATHVKMAWKMVDRTKGLSETQREKARERILHRAKQLGIDTSDWNVQADSNSDENGEGGLRGESCLISFEAMAIEFPEVKDHPNQLPFSGILTRVDQPSDNPLHGSNGKCVLLPKSVAEKALDSLGLMAIDFTPSLDGHDSKNKIGIITAANIEGNAINISGFFYASDFPDEVKRIQDEKAKLGFSYEAQAHIKSMNDDPLEIDQCIFTGAAVLYKDRAAYTSTALQAKAQTEKFIMSDNQFDTLMKEFEEMKKNMSEIKASMGTNKMEAASVSHLIKPHAEALRGCAASMAAAGIGLHASKGHVAVLHKMADNMEAEAAEGKIPHVYQTQDFYNASAEHDSKSTKEVDDLKDQISSMMTKLDDLKKTALTAGADVQAERKTVPANSRVLMKAGLDPNQDKYDVSKLDAALDKVSGMQIHQKIALKQNLAAQGRLDPCL